MAEKFVIVAPFVLVVVWMIWTARPWRLSGDAQRDAFRDHLVEHYRDCNRKNIAEYDEARQGRDEALADLLVLGGAFAKLYLQAINGVVCDPTEEPGRHNCAACREAWKTGKLVLDKYDAKWGSGYRSGSVFQPAYPRDLAKEPNDG